MSQNNNSRHEKDDLGWLAFGVDAAVGLLEFFAVWIIQGALGLDLGLHDVVRLTVGVSVLIWLSDEPLGFIERIQKDGIDVMRGHILWLFVMGMSLL